MSEYPLLIFLHIPKTGGTTLRTIMERQYKNGEFYELDRWWRNQEAIDEYKRLTQEHRSKIRLLKGHFCFGVHILLDQPYTYMTFLRDPFDRVVSTYYYIRRRSRHELHNWVVSTNISLPDFVCSGRLPDVDNGQTRQLSGVRDAFTSVGFGECTREMLEKAKQNLRDHIPHVGLTEEFDKSLLIMQRNLGWGRVHYVRRNSTTDRPDLRQVSNETMKLIQGNNAFDIELYGFARQLFEERVRQNESWLKQELPRFQIENDLYNRLYFLLKRILPTPGLRDWARKHA